MEEPSTRRDPVTAAAAAALFVQTALASEGGTFRLLVTFEDARVVSVPQDGATATIRETISG